MITVATTEDEIKQGLSGVEHLDDSDAMLFVLPYRQSFWMHGMLVPLDMFWLDDYGRVVAIAENLQPCYPGEYCPSYLPADDVDFSYVLETAAGFAERYDIQVGDHMRL